MADRCNECGGQQFRRGTTTTDKRIAVCVNCGCIKDD